jgi:hypothetical protein
MDLRVTQADIERSSREIGTHDNPRTLLVHVATKRPTVCTSRTSGKAKPPLRNPR